MAPDNAPAPTETAHHADEHDGPVGSAGLGDIVRAYLTKLRGGELGSLPAILGLVVLVLVF